MSCGAADFEPIVTGRQSLLTAYGGTSQNRRQSGHRTAPYTGRYLGVFEWWRRSLPSVGGRGHSWWVWSGV